MFVRNASEFWNFCTINNLAFNRFAWGGDLFTTNGGLSNTIDFSFKGADHLTLRFPNNFNLEPVRIKKKYAEFDWDGANKILVINKIIAIKI